MLLATLTIAAGLWGVVAAQASSGAPAYTATRLPTLSVTDSAQFRDMDCWSAGNCVAVGDTSVSGSSGTRQIIAQETNGTWAAVTAPPPPTGGSYGRLNAVSCPAAGECVAVGRVGTDSSSTGTLIETLSAGSWTATTSDLPGSYSGELLDVSCTSTTFCAAVGSYAGVNPPFRGLLEVFDGAHWTASAANAPLVHAGDDPAATTTTLAAVSCASAGKCVAVGRSNSGTNYGYQDAVIATLAGGSWTTVNAAEPGNGTAETGNLTTVACASATRCVAAGTYDVYDADSHESTITGQIDTLSASGWTPTAAPVPAEADYVTPAVASCASDGTCAVAGVSTGDSHDSHNEFPVVITSTGGSTPGAWATIPAGLPADAVGPAYVQRSYLATVSCVDAQHCIAGGSYDTIGSGRRGLIVTASPSASTASVEPAPLPADATTPATGQDATVVASRCLDAAHCALLGFYQDDSAISLTAGFVDTTGAVAPPPAKPKVTSVSPGAGRTGGGTTVTIKGTALSGATAVTFGGHKASHLVVVSATQLRVTAPTHSAGSVDVRVTTASGVSAVTAADRYVYRATPKVTSVSPHHGSHKGGKKVTVHGSGFAGPLTVKFGSTPATSVKVVSSTKLTVRSPKHAKGTVHLTVKTAGGTSATGSKDKFTFK